MINISDDGSPIYLQICEFIKSEILGGKYKPGDALPSIRQLSALYGVNPNTIQKSMIQLDNEGFTNSERTRIRTVTATPKEIEKFRLKEGNKITKKFISDMTAYGFNYSEISSLLQKELENYGSN